VLLDLIAPIGGFAPTVTRPLDAPAWGPYRAGAVARKAPTVLGVLCYLHHVRRLPCADIAAVYGVNSDTMRRWVKGVGRG